MRENLSYLASDEVFRDEGRRMDRAEFRAAIKTIGVSQVAAAKLFDVHISTIRNWLYISEVPMWVTILLRLMIARGISVEEVRHAATGKLGRRRPTT